MPLPRVYRVVQDSLGNVVPQVLCSVLNEGTGVLATLWQDDAGTIPLSNPMTSDATYGSFGFYVTPGHYDLTFTKPGYTFQPQLDMQVPQDDLTLGTMAQQDAANVAITGGTATGLSSLSTTGTIGVQNAAFADTALFIMQYKNTGQYGIIIHPNTDNTKEALLFQNAATTAVGSIVATATATAYNTTSDARLKHAITALTGALGVVQALRPVHFLWNANDEQGHGFLAHELQQVVPEAVSGLPDEVNPDGTIKPQQVDHSKLVVWLVSALKEVVDRLEICEAKLNGI